MKQIWTNTKLNGEVDSHEYDLLDEGEKITLFYSQKSEWTKPGEQVMTFENDGDGITIMNEENLIRIDYAEAFLILVGLMHMVKDKFEIRETKTVYKWP